MADNKKLELASFVANREKRRAEFLNSAFADREPVVPAVSTSTVPKAQPVRKRVKPMSVSADTPSKSIFAPYEIEASAFDGINRAVEYFNPIDQLGTIRDQQRPVAGKESADLWFERYGDQNKSKANLYLPTDGTPASSLFVGTKPLRSSSVSRADGSTPIDKMEPALDHRLGSMEYRANPNAELRDSYGGESGLSRHLSDMEKLGSRKQDVANTYSVLGKELGNKVISSQRGATDPSNDVMVRHQLAARNDAELERMGNANGFYDHKQTGPDRVVVRQAVGRDGRSVIGLHEQGHSRYLDGRQDSYKYDKEWVDRGDEISAVVSSVKQSARRKNKNLFKNPSTIDNDIDSILDKPNEHANWGNLDMVIEGMEKRHGKHRARQILRSLFKVIAKNDDKGKGSDLV